MTPRCTNDRCYCDDTASRPWHLPFVLCLAFGALVFTVAGIKSCSDDLDAQREEVRAVLRAGGYTPLEIPRSYRDEAGVREVRARVERGGVVGEVVVFRDGTGPWRIAAEKR